MLNSNAISKAIATIEGREMIITRSFQAPRELVYKAWTDPKHLPEWWGPEGFTTTVQEIEVKPGGVWRYTMHGPDGVNYENKITYIDVDGPERLVYSHGDDTEDELFRVTVSMEQQGRGTKLTMRALFKTVEELEKSVKEYGAIEGAQSTLSRLEDQIPKVTYTKAAGTEFTMERIFQAPRELVFKAFTTSEHLSQWFAPRGWTVPVSNLDFRVGGSWHFCMKCEDKNQGDFYGFESWGKALYHEIVTPEKIVYTDYFSDAEGNVTESMPSGTVTITFEEYEGKTKVVSTIKYPTTEDLNKVIEMGMEQGATETWDRLAELLPSMN